MSVDTAFQGAGKQAGLEAWRIENLQPVKVSSKDIGKLYTGDSYIFLYTKQGKSGLSWNIHFWLGSQTSQDESGVAAFKTVELDESLGGGPVQYRECQGHESDLFLSYFKSSGIEYLSGGVASGFKTVDRDAYETKLFQVKGKRTVRVTQVDLSPASLTIDDVYILDAGLNLYVYNGKTANRMEKAKGLEFVRKVANEERGGKAVIHFMDEDPENMGFWSALGCSQPQNITKVGDSDDAHEQKLKKKTTILHVSDSDGQQLTVKNVTPANSILTKDLLLSDDIFIIDTGDVVYIWVGKNASSNERKNAMSIATKYLSQSGHPVHTPITRVVETGEPTVFTSLFKNWNPPVVMSFGNQASQGIASTVTDKSVDVKDLLRNKGRSEEQAIMPDGKHEVKVWRIVNMEKVELPEHLYGQFYGGDSYIVLHSVTPPSGGKVSSVIYFWQGRSSSTDEKASSALLAKQLDDDMGGSPVQVRVIQGKEPAHFRALFKGKMIIHSGGTASGFSNVDDKDSYDTDGVSLYHVKGTNPDNTVASQVDEVASNLNSGDCFVLETPATVYIWMGHGSSPPEQDLAVSIGNILRKSRSAENINEGSESEEFWGYLGGKMEYASEKMGFECPHEPRLFHCSNSYGYFNAEEIVDFAQDDLNVDDVFLLDTYTCLYVWIGSGANEAEKRGAMNLADDYLKVAESDGRGDGTPVVTVMCGNEPIMFTSQFLAWDPAFFQRNEFIDPYEARLQKLKEEKEKNQPKDLAGTVTSESVNQAAQTAPAKAIIAPGSGQTYTYEQLQQGVDGIDITTRELYLSDTEFTSVMGMSKAEFAKMPKWKQVAKKKETKLF